jgi:hypothetical protein
MPSNSGCQELNIIHPKKSELVGYWYHNSYDYYIYSPYYEYLVFWNDSLYYYKKITDSIIEDEETGIFKVDSNIVSTIYYTSITSFQVNVTRNVTIDTILSGSGRRDSLIGIPTFTYDTLINSNPSWKMYLRKDGANLCSYEYTDYNTEPGCYSIYDIATFTRVDSTLVKPIMWSNIKQTH